MFLELENNIYIYLIKAGILWIVWTWRICNSPTLNDFLYSPILLLFIFSSDNKSFSKFEEDLLPIGLWRMLTYVRNQFLFNYMFLIFALVQGF